MASTLELVLIFLASAVLVVVVFRTLHLPPLLGYLLAGIASGHTRWAGYRNRGKAVTWLSSGSCF